MARKRTIDPDLWTDDRVQQLPTVLAVLLYIGAISHADDEGRIEWSARQLYAKVFPLRDDVKIKDVETAMSAIVTSELVKTYVVGSRTYGVHPSWRKHQYVNRPSKSRIPEPPYSLNVSVSNSVSESGWASAPEAVKPQVPSVSVSVSVSDSDSDSELATLAERARAGDWADLPPERSQALTAMDQDLAFGFWFLEDGIAARVIPGHHGLDKSTGAHRTREVAAKLIASYGVAECRRRALCMFERAALKTPDRWRIVSIPMLAEHWDMFDGAQVTGKHVRTVGANEQALLRQLA